jgi:AcrR family transcriptional regulator
MGSKERRERHRARVRQAILVTARELFVVNGVRNASLRQIAARLEYSPTAFYTYFRSKNDIFAALVDEDTAILKRRVSEATRDAIDPLGRVRCALWTLYEFQKVNPLFLELMFLDSSAARKTAGRQRFECLDGIAAGVEADLSECIERGQVSGALTAATARGLLWVGMLGVATVAPRLACGDENCDAFARDLLETLLAGLSTACDRREGTIAQEGHCDQRVFHTAAVPEPDPPLAR